MNDVHLDRPALRFGRQLVSGPVEAAHNEHGRVDVELDGAAQNPNMTIPTRPSPSCSIARSTPSKHGVSTTHGSASFLEQYSLRDRSALAAELSRSVYRDGGILNTNRPEGF